MIDRDLETWMSKHLTRKMVKDPDFSTRGVPTINYAWSAVRVSLNQSRSPDLSKPGRPVNYIHYPLGSGGRSSTMQRNLLKLRIDDQMQAPGLLDFSRHPTSTDSRKVSPEWTLMKSTLPRPSICTPRSLSPPSSILYELKTYRSRSFALAQFFLHARVSFFLKGRDILER